MRRLGEGFGRSYLKSGTGPKLFDFLLDPARSRATHARRKPNINTKPFETNDFKENQKSELNSPFPPLFLSSSSCFTSSRAEIHQIRVLETMEESLMEKLGRVRAGEKKERRREREWAQGGHCPLCVHLNPSTRSKRVECSGCRAAPAWGSPEPTTLNSPLRARFRSDSSPV